MLIVLQYSIFLMFFFTILCEFGIGIRSFDQLSNIKKLSLSMHP